MTELIFLDDLTQDEHSVGSDPRIAGGAISIGNFDGVHRGHASLLRQVRTMADCVGGPAVAVTFDPHPAQWLRPDSVPDRLTWLQLRAERMATLGIDALVVCPTSKDFLRLSPEKFFERLILGRLRARGIVEGPNFFFGHQRQGDTALLERLAGQHQMECVIVESYQQQGQTVSSSTIRQALARGEVAQANRDCGFLHCIEGVVAPGQRRGRTIGFPTANLSEVRGTIPSTGVYAGVARTGPEAFKAAIHIGPNPTFEDSAVNKVEVHLLGYDGDLYGQTLRVDFVERLRSVEKFETAESLIAQLQRDLAATGRAIEPSFL